MKIYTTILCFLFLILLGCNASQNFTVAVPTKIVNDTIRITNDRLEYEVIIIDVGFSSWFNSNARQRGYYSQSYLEARNKVWILEWNKRVNMPLNYDVNLYGMPINYDFYINYGYEVNYMIFNYLTYFQLKNNQQLGGFPAKI